MAALLLAATETAMAVPLPLFVAQIAGTEADVLVTAIGPAMMAGTFQPVMVAPLKSTWELKVTLPALKSACPTTLRDLLDTEPVFMARMPMPFTAFVVPTT